MMMDINTNTDYMTNAQGHRVPIDLVSDIDKARNDLVQEIVSAANALRETMINFKIDTLADIGAFVELSAEKYGAKLGGKKGNVTLTSYDGSYKVVRSIGEYLVFDERLQVAKELIDECIHVWSKGSNDNIRALVEHAFQVDKQGKVSTGRILGLTRLDIKDATWRKAMQAITDSMQVSGTATYVRVYRRIGDDDQWEQVALDIAKL